MLEVRNIGFHVNGFSILNGVSLSVREGEIVALIGPNGSGKTTLFNVVGGFLRHTSGTVKLAGREVDRLSIEGRVEIGLGRLWQDVRLFQRMTVLENLVVAKKNNLGDALWRSFIRRNMVKQAGIEIREKAEHYLQLVGLAEKKDVEAENLSFGQQKLLALCRLFMNDATILLLDEPYAGVNVVLFERINLILEKMKNDKRCVLIIEHNIGLVREVAQRMYALDEGRVIAEGLPDDVTNSAAVREAYAGI
jgi:ABC-type branched-subunit amino acid transport system ATPase component